MSYIGIDIGGSKMRGVLWDGGRVLSAAELPTPRQRQAFERALAALAERIAASAAGRVRGIGIGVAGVVKGTRVQVSPNIPYLKHFDFRVLFPSLPLKVDNDARAFLRAECSYGAGRTSARVFAVTLGTGVGRAYGERGRVMAIKRFEYPESWERQYQAVRDRKDDRALAEFLAAKLAAIIRRRRPSVLIFGGGVIRRPGFLAQLKTELRRRRIRQPIRSARLGKNAAAIGAALLFAGR